MSAEPIRRERGERRNRDAQVLEAAISVFSEKGYSAASLQDVADRVGLLKGSLYHYISSKESLLYRICVDAHEQALLVMAEVDALELRPDKKLLEYIERLTLWYLSYRERAGLYFTEWRYLTGEHLETVRQQRREFEHYLRAILVDAAEQGYIRSSQDARVASFYILAAVNSVPIWYRPSDPKTPEEIAQEVALMSYHAAFGRATARRKAAV